MGKRRRQGDPSRDGCESTDSEDGGQEETRTALSCPHVGKAANLPAVKKTLKIAWVKVGNCTTCNKENKVVSQVKKGPKAKVGAKLTAAEIKKEQLERAKAEQKAASEKLKKEKEAKERLAAVAEEQKKQDEKIANSDHGADKELQEKKTENVLTEAKITSKPVEPPSIWLCLKCGSQGCSSSEKTHSVQHFRQPRSDLHCLAVNIATWVIWCYECEHEVFVDSHKKLYEVVEYIKKIKEQGVKHLSMVTPKGPNNLSFGTIQPLGGGSGKTLHSGTATYTKGGLLRVKGLSNLGNTCFFNSVMQCLSQTHLLTSLLELQAVKGVSLDVPGVEACVLSTNEESESDVEGLGLESFAGISVQLAEGGPMVTSLAAFFKEMGMQGKAGVFSPSQLFAQVVKQAPKFRGLQQQDSHELLRYLMDGLRNEEQRRQKSAILKHFGLTEKTDPKSVVKSMRRKLRVYGRQANHTLLDRVFSGQLVSTIVCEECGHSSRRYEQFLDISLPVVEDKPHKPLKKHHQNASAGDNLDIGEEGCVALEKKSKSQSKKEKERKRKEKRLKARKGKTARVSENEDEEGEEKIRAELQESDEKIEAAEIFNDVDAVESEAEAITLQNGESKPLDEKNLIPKEHTVMEALEELEDEKRVITSSGFRRHASLVAAEESEGLFVGKQAHNDDEGYEEEEGGRCLEDEAEWEWDYGDSVVADKQTIKVKAKTPETTLEETIDNSETSCVIPKSADEEILDGINHTTAPHDEKEKSSEKTADNSDDDLDEEETGASSNGDVEDNTDDDDVKKWVVDKNYLNNLKKLDDLMQVGDNLDPHMSKLCKSIASLDLGMRAQKRERVEAEWTARTLATLAPRYQVSPGECSLYSCLNSFTQSELLSGSNKWACERCTQIAASNPDNSDAQESTKVEGEKKPATVYSSASKQMLVFSPPAVLTLQLKRFQQTMSGCKKVNKHVTFPVTLDLAAFCSSTCVALPHMSLDPSVLYSLYGVVEHSGSLRGGHYVAYVKTRSSGSPYQVEYFIWIGYIALAFFPQDLSTFFNPPLARASDVPSFLEEVDRKLRRNKAVIKDKEEEEVEDTVNNNKLMVEKELNDGNKGRWFHVSDSAVQEVQEDKVLKAQAYLLFYERIR